MILRSDFVRIWRFQVQIEIQPSNLRGENYERSRDLSVLSRMVFESLCVEFKIPSCFRLCKSVQFFNRAPFTRICKLDVVSVNMVICDYVIFIKSTLFWLIYSILTIIYLVWVISRRNFMIWWKKLKLKKMVVFHIFLHFLQFLDFEGLQGSLYRKREPPMDKNMY